MAERPMGNGQLTALCICILLVCGSSTKSVDAKKHGPEKLLVYTHEDRTVPGNTIIASAYPKGNYSFGAIFVLANLVTDGFFLSNSTKLGRARGLVSIEEDLSEFATYSYLLNATSYSGTVSVQGLVSGGSKGSGDLAVTGGTGDFLWARGHVEVVTLSDTDVEDVVISNKFYLRSLQGGLASVPIGLLLSGMLSFFYNGLSSIMTEIK